MNKVIDSHIHLFSETHLKNRFIPWIEPHSKLAQNYRLDEYLKIAGSKYHKVEGAIFIETNVENDLDEEGWKIPTEEYLYIERTILGKQLEGEGSVSGTDFIRAIIPWAPLPKGSDKLQAYVDVLKSKSVDSNTFNLVKGFRYLLQARPKGTMLQPGFIDSLNWLAEQGFVFDLGLDVRSDGIWQLEEFVELVKRTKNVRYILNHLSKPILTLSSKSLAESDKFQRWKYLISQVASDKNNDYYIKISGGFSELPPEVVNETDLNEAFDRIKPWLETFTQLFPKDHFIFGSDWPVCALKVNETEATWEKWARITDISLREFGLGDEVYYENVIKAYNLDIQ